MKLPDVPKMLQPLALGDYVKELEGVTVQIWINPPVSLFNRFHEIDRRVADTDLRAKKLLEKQIHSVATDKDALDIEARALITEKQDIGNARITWLAEIWSQGPEETRWTVDEITQGFIDAYGETDPKLFLWVLGKTWMMIHEHRTQLKNFWKPLVSSSQQAA